VLRSGGPNHSKSLCVLVFFPLFQLTSKTLRPLLILGFRAGALRHPAGDLLSDRLQQTYGSLMFCLDPLITVTSGHILCYLSFRTVPPEYLLQVLIHFLATSVYRIRCLMSFLENQFLDRFDVGNAQPVLKPYHSFCIFTEIWAFPICD
jgi:hypothetical protein